MPSSRRAHNREVLYVSATRGRESNNLYVDTSFDPDPATGHEPAISQRTAREVLAGVLANAGCGPLRPRDPREGTTQAEDFKVLAAEYETLAQAAQQHRLDELISRSGLDQNASRRSARALPTARSSQLSETLEAHGLDVEEALPGLVAARSLDDTDGPSGSDPQPSRPVGRRRRI